MITIDVYALARREAQWHGKIALAAMPRLGASLLRTEGSIAYRCRAGRDARGRPALHLELHGNLILRCDRCGGECDLAIGASRQFFFVPTEAELAAQPIDETPEEALLGSAHFDLAALIEDEAILQLPISPRHEQCELLGRLTQTEVPGEPVHPFAALAVLRERLRGAK